VARLIRTEKEVEGRYEDVWIVVDEDALDQWPEGPLTTVGQEVPRVDGLDRARGQVQYTADLQLPGMLHTAVLRSPYARARVTNIDLDAARAARGVRAVLGPGELDVLKEEPGYVGQSVAAVAAETFGQAQAALQQLNVEWEALEPLLDPDEAVKQESFVSDVQTYERGDFERGVAEADAVVEAEYRTQVVLHNSMETHQAVCHWEDDGITVYISTQYIWGIRDSVAEHLELPPDKVRVVCHAMGGGFGSKNSPGDYTPIAAELANRTGRPVKCALTRREENIAAGNRNATIQRLTAAAKSDGTLVALGGEFVNAIGFSGWSASTEGPMKMLYACENVRTVQYPVKVNLPPMAAFRAPGFVEGTFALECLLDELAAKLDIDPLELRRRNYASSDRVDDRPFSSKNLEECYRRAEPHWAKREEVRARSNGPWKHGIGLASQIWYGGGGPPSYAWIRIGADGRAQVVTAMQDIGTGTRTAMAQIAAEELGIPFEHVQVSLGDSARGPFASISAGSSTIPSMGPPVRSAAADAKRQLIEIAAQRFHLEERVLAVRSSRPTAARGRSPRSRACSKTGRSSARARVGRTPRGCRC
jgi:CO/xanthine dehydrogenase Mo-binding subunit